MGVMTGEVQLELFAFDTQAERDAHAHRIESIARVSMLAADIFASLPTEEAERLRQEALEASQGFVDF